MYKKNKPINMATGGLMNMPPFIKKDEEQKEQGITAYDVNTPKEARQGLPSRLLAPSRTRFRTGGFPDRDGSGDITQKDILIEKGILDADGNMISKRTKSAHGGFHSMEDVTKYLNDPANADEIKKMKEKIDTESFKNFLLNKSKEKFMNEEKPVKKKAKTIAVAGGGLLRQKYAIGDEVEDNKSLSDIIKDLEPLEEAPAEGDIPGETKNQSAEEIENMISRLEAEKKLSVDSSVKSNLDNQIDKLKTLRMKKVRAATGGLMKMSIGGAAGTSERYDRRKDYQAYAEGDMVEDESLMSPTGMNETDMGRAEADMEMMAEEDAEFGDMDSVVDTSALSEDEEKVVDDAVEMFPELEGIIPKIVATEFTEDGEVEGPGTGTSDSIPALLSDGEFVFTAKAVKHLGVDKLRKMMKDAEAAYDAGMQNQEADAAMAE
ncbi:hypothetical protein HTVC104P_gp81 [Pelagibacter phage HTVC104P]|nr:hypothetical protein HTVC104P_gp81 [Pelagibacter phage HTVC104P]